MTVEQAAHFIEIGMIDLTRGIPESIAQDIIANRHKFWLALYRRANRCA